MLSHLTTVAPKHKRPPELLLVMSLPSLKDLEFNCEGFQPREINIKIPTISLKVSLKTALS